MRDFIKRALGKFSKLTAEQIRDLLVSAAEEIDRLETVLDSLSEGILVCDSDHCLVLANKHVERYLPMSYGPENEPVWRTVRDEKAAEFLEATLCSGDRVEDREFDFEVKGIQWLISVSVLPLVKDHHVTGSLIHLQDITEKRKKEAQLRRAENLASLTTVAAGVAHEIKNPLGSLSIHVQLIQKLVAANREKFGRYYAEDDAQDPRRSLDLMDKYIAVINEEIDRLNHIVVDFLFAVRPMHLEFRKGDINSFIKELTGFVSFELEQSRITYVLDLAEDLPLIEFDERYMKQALLNLIKNAIAAMPGGGTLTIRTGVKDDQISILVQDTGVGIAETILPKIFEPYFTTKETGSGLGLTLVFKIIQEHKGEISLRSREGEGTCFTILLPVPQRERRLISFGGAGNSGRADEI
jgi:signal transduction histidine kinase